ncbi:MAG: hypothetical protein IH949_08000 [Bacteroidetes bacterium]|nr:hypothetical protein [Bacteroidota bacterium]
MKKIIVVSLIFISTLAAQPEFSSISSQPGAFSRMGFGARGMGMGNAMSSVKYGNLVSYYNPALSVFQKDNSFQTSYAILSLDRKLNFLNFTKHFTLPSKGKGISKKKGSDLLAGVSIGIINAGVGDIIGRDNQGNNIGVFSTTENQFFVSVAKELSKKLALGIAIKFYNYNLFQDITSSGIGFDLGGIYSLNAQWTLSFMVADLNSKYKWDTVPLLQQSGSQTENKFPLLKKIGVSYLSKKFNTLVAAELESSNAGTTIFRIGAEHYLAENFTLRGGIDQYNLKNSDFPVRPSLGASFIRKVGNFLLSVDYAYVIERYSPDDRHIVGITARF